jgi:V8-like Glu-specific endopeptidase
MLRFTVLSGARTGARFELVKPVVRLGRAPDNDVVFDPNVDLDASAHHAEIRAEGAVWMVVDLASRNGVFLPNANMQRISRHPLPAQEVIQLGPQGPRVGIEVLAPPQQTTLASPGAQLPQNVAAGGPGQTQLVDPAAPPPVPNIEPPGPPAPAAPAGKMGQQTLLAHVNALVGQQKRGKSTLEIKALVDQNVQKATGKMRAIIGVLIALVVLAGAAIVFLAFRQEDPETLRKELEKLSMNDPRRKEIEQKLGEKSPENPDIGHDIYEQNKNALFMLVAHKGKNYERGGFCTAFAIKPRVLASNAHCVRAAEDFEDQGAEIYAHLNESAKKGKPKMLKVGRHKGHPAYRHNAQNITPDVGLFTLEDEDAGATVTLAPEDQLKRLGTGDALYVLGFPGRTMDEDSPVAVFMFSHVGRITDEFGQKPDKFKDAWLVQHEGQTTPGTSGSPIFNGEGRVVAINAGGLLEQNQQAVYKYAMRIDLLDGIDLSSSSGDDDDDDGESPKKKKKSDDDDDDSESPKKKKKSSDDDDD